MKKHLFYLLLTLSCTELFAFSPAISSGNPGNSTKAPLNKGARRNGLLNGLTYSIASAEDLQNLHRIPGGSSGDPTVVTLDADIILTDASQYLIIGDDHVVFDGNNHTITINTAATYSGLFQNGSLIGPVNGYSNITIKNIRVVAVSTGLVSGGGWIGQAGYGLNATDIYIDNCHSDYQNLASGVNAGGIVGRTSPATVLNCSSNGPISTGGGGICGRAFSGTVINCHSEGAITNANSGGITGSFSTGTAINCYSTGDITGISSGGIMGTDAGNNGSSVITSATAINCYSTGNISASSSGGIMAQRFNGTVTNCYSTGNITGTNAGGIAGYLSPGNVTNCYTTGAIGADAGGIVGNQCSGTITNCYTIGTEAAFSRGLTGSSFTGTISGTNVSSYSGFWEDNLASTALTGTDGTVWTDVNLSSPGVPFKLTAFDAAIYTPSNQEQLNNTVVNSPAGNFSSGTYSIISLDGANPSSGIASIDSDDGTLSFNNPGLGSYVAKVLYTDGVNGSYQINSYTLNVVSVLPLTWLSFDVRAKGTSALLSWSTASEQNTHNFEVQHSINGNAWNKIGTVAAKGNSSVTTTYNYSDLKPVNGNNYYRLKQTDIDGKYNYSIVRNLHVVAKNKTFSLLNNPVSNGVLQVNVQAPTTLRLYKSDGSLLWKKQLNSGTNNISLYNISKGIYFLMDGDNVERVIVW